MLEELSLEDGGYILLSAHREENIDDEAHFLSLMNAVNALAEQYNLPVIYSTHPRSKKIIEARGFTFHQNVRSLKPFGFYDYNHLQQQAFCVVSDSGTLPEEASYFHFPAVSIRTSTERPEGLDKGCFIIGNITAERVLQAVNMAVIMHERHDNGLSVPDYMDENVSTKVVRIIQSYTGIINQMYGGKNKRFSVLEYLLASLCTLPRIENIRGFVLSSIGSSRSFSVS
jgi:UDP-N-acetylglucosamine 2-epimerase (non-hydrolysing)